MPTYAQDDKWTFDYEWKQMKARIDTLEKRLYRLERFKATTEEKEIQNYYKNKE